MIPAYLQQQIQFIDLLKRCISKHNLNGHTTENLERFLLIAWPFQDSKDPKTIIRFYYVFFRTLRDKNDF